jgi:hypothetical protein
MKLARVSNTPAALADFFQEGLEALGAVCERTWHDRLQLVAEGPAARLWNAEGALLEREIHFIAPEETGARKADEEVFPGCPLTFRLAEELRPRPLPLERAVLQTSDPNKPPAPDVAEKLWHAQMPGTSRWRIEGAPAADWHFSLLGLARCEIQAIDQHWSLHRVAVSLTDGHVDPSLASGLDFMTAASTDAPIQWPALAADRWQDALTRALRDELQADLTEIRERQQRYLGRELERIDQYFDHYQKELIQRSHRTQAEGARVKAEERLAAAKAEHERRRQDQIHRHEIRVITHLDALIMLAEPAWRARVSCTERGESRTRSALLIPRARRWSLSGDSVTCLK